MTLEGAAFCSKTRCLTALRLSLLIDMCTDFKNSSVEIFIKPIKAIPSSAINILRGGSNGLHPPVFSNAKLLNFSANNAFTIASVSSHTNFFTLINEKKMRSGPALAIFFFYAHFKMAATYRCRLVTSIQTPISTGIY